MQCCYTPMTIVMASPMANLLQNIFGSDSKQSKVKQMGVPLPPFFYLEISYDRLSPRSHWQSRQQDLCSLRFIGFSCPNRVITCIASLSFVEISERKFEGWERKWLTFNAFPNEWNWKKVFCVLVNLSVSLYSVSKFIWRAHTHTHMALHFRSNTPLHNIVLIGHCYQSCRVFLR